MVNGFTFFTAQPGFIPFPAATEVFTEQAEQYAEQFIPLASVQLGKVRISPRCEIIVL